MKFWMHGYQILDSDHIQCTPKHTCRYILLHYYSLGSEHVSTWFPDYIATSLLAQSLAFYVISPALDIIQLQYIPQDLERGENQIHKQFKEKTG